MALGPLVGAGDDGAVHVVAELPPGVRPALQVREDDAAGRWTDEPGDAGWSGAPAGTTDHQRLGDGWVHRFTVAGLDPGRAYRYRWIDRRTGGEIDGLRGRFRPAPPGLLEPCSLIVTSCNKRQAYPRAAYEHVWEELAAHLDRDPSIRLLLHLGDQVYCDKAWDPVWEEYREQAFLLPRKKKQEWYECQKPLWTRRYRRIYRQSWDSPAVRRVLRSVPSLMMWDDHEIHDGYGSRATDFWTYRPHLAAVARRMFDEYQGSLNPRGSSRLGDSRGFSVPLFDSRLVVLDGRSHRDARKRKRQLLGESQWRALEQVLERHQPADGPLLLVSAGPLYNFLLSRGYRKLVRRIVKLSGLADDLRDAWDSEANREELDRLLAALERLRRRDVPIVVLAGDLHLHHLAHWWRGSDESRLIHQVTSSPLTNEPRGRLTVEVGYGPPPVDPPDSFRGDFSARVQFFANRRGYAQIRLAPTPGGPPRLSVNYHIEQKVGQPLEAQGWVDLD
jgi:phosphodiesterase/alkaline phosphatase D-like protein